MNKLDNTDETGGYPLVMDDFRWMQDAYLDGFKALTKFIHDYSSGGTPLNFMLLTNDPNLVIDASNSWTFPETYCVIAGEIYKIPATVLSSSPASGEYYTVSVATSYDSNGTKTFDDGGVHETHLIRTAQLTKETFPAIGSFIALNGSATNWTVNESYTFRNRMLRNLNLFDLENIVDDVVDRTNELSASYTSITPTTTNVRSSTSSTAGDNVAVTSVTGGYIKYKKVGNQIFVDFRLQGVEIQAGSSGYIQSVYFEESILGITSGSNFRSSGIAVNDVSSYVSGACQIFRSGTKIVMRVPLPFNALSYARLNDGYDFSSTTSPVLTAKNNTAVTPSWTFSGQFVMEFS